MSDAEARALNRKIAEKLGWCVEWRYHPEDKAGGYVLIAPGENDGVVLCTKPEYAWEAMPNGDYAHSLDAVAAVLTGKSVQMLVSIMHGSVLICEWDVCHGYHEYFSRDGSDDIAANAARALLAWLEAQTP